MRPLLESTVATLTPSVRENAKLDVSNMAA
jgi:hypothetical protein